MKEIKFNPQQAEVISHREGPMIVLSVAGSGKTMVLTERVIHLIEQGLDPARLLAITFAKKAVLEIQTRLKKRLNGNGDRALLCTFHSLGYRILRAENSAFVGFRLVQNGDQLKLFREAIQKVGMEDDPASVMKRISLAKNDLVSPADLEGSDKKEDKQLAKIFSCYELLKRRKRLFDFDDLLYRPYQLLKSNGDIGWRSKWSRTMMPGRNWRSCKGTTKSPKLSSSQRRSWNWRRPVIAWTRLPFWPGSIGLCLSSRGL